MIPEALKGTTLAAYVGGQTAGYIDLADRISERLPLVIATVIVLSFLLLLIAFRSIVVPLTAGLMNLLSVGAAYGILTFVFQEGHGAKLIGLSGPIPIVSYVPLLMFAILFGLSMDYQVFLLTRIQEHYRKTKDNHEAVVDGLAVSATGDHLGGADHGQRLHQLHPQRRPDREAVRARPGGGDRGGRDGRPLPAGARGDGAAGPRELVAAALGRSGCRASGSRARSSSGPGTPRRPRRLAPARLSLRALELHRRSPR